MLNYAFLYQLGFRMLAEAYNPKFSKVNVTDYDKTNSRRNNKNALTTATRLACLEIRSRN